MQIMLSDTDPSKVVVSIEHNELTVTDRDGKMRTHKFPAPLVMSEEISYEQLCNMMMELVAEVIRNFVTDEAERAQKLELPRYCRRLFRLSHAASADSSRPA